jgi:hypothetical protein
VAGPKWLVDDPSQSLPACAAAPTFKAWLESVDPKFLIEGLHFQSVDMFGPNIGFLKFKAACFDRASHQFLPGIVFMRGGSVGILVVLVAEDTGEEFTVAVKQPRMPTGDFDSMEITAGMLDNDGNFAGKAAEELAEETGGRTRIAHTRMHPSLLLARANACLSGLASAR